MTLAEKIAALRGDRRLSQGDLAEMLDVSRQSVSKWETGQAVPELDKIVKLADVFGVTLDELVREGTLPETGTLQPETHQSETLQPEAYQSEAHQSETLQPEKHQSEIYQSEAYQSEAHQSEKLQPETHQSETHQSEAHQSEKQQPEALESEMHQAEPKPKIVYVERRLAGTQIVGAVLLVLGLLSVILGAAMSGTAGTYLAMAGAAMVILGLPFLLARKHPFLIAGWVVLAVSCLIFNPYTSVSPWGLRGGVFYLYMYFSMPEMRYITTLFAAAVGIVRGLLSLVLIFFTARVCWKSRKHDTSEETA